MLRFTCRLSTETIHAGLLRLAYIILFIFATPLHWKRDCVLFVLANSFTCASQLIHKYFTGKLSNFLKASDNETQTFRKKLIFRRNFLSLQSSASKKNTENADFKQCISYLFDNNKPIQFIICCAHFTYPIGKFVQFLTFLYLFLSFLYPTCLS